MKCSGSNGYPDAQGRLTPKDDAAAWQRFKRLERAVKRLME